MAGALVKSWSNRPATVALSSAEAELYAASKATAELMGMVSLMADLAWEVVAVQGVFTNSSEACAIAGRRGLGRTRHIEVKKLWIQDAIEAKKIKIQKVKGVDNPADPLTKLKALRDVSALLSRVGVLEFISGFSARC